MTRLDADDVTDLLQTFNGDDLTETLSRIETLIRGVSLDDDDPSY